MLIIHPLCRSSHFNPRSREGSDEIRVQCYSDLANFNPRSREGSDELLGVTPTTVSQFQSTLPRRERPAIITVIFLKIISIHAPAKGATLSCAVRQAVRRHFNPRSREGSDLPLERRLSLLQDFNPRSREGSDQQRAELTAMQQNFNPRSREGSDTTPDK